MSRLLLSASNGLEGHEEQGEHEKQHEQGEPDGEQDDGSEPCELDVVVGVSLLMRAEPDLDGLGGLNLGGVPEKSHRRSSLTFLSLFYQFRVVGSREKMRLTDGGFVVRTGLRVPGQNLDTLAGFAGYLGGIRSLQGSLGLLTKTERDSRNQRDQVREAGLLLCDPVQVNLPGAHVLVLSKPR